MASPADEQLAWIGRVLGIALPVSTATKPPEPRSLISLFVAAKDKADAQIAKLQAAFRGVDHPLAPEIADRGLIGLNRSVFVPLQAALRDYAGASPARQPKSAQELRAAIARCEAFLATNKVLPALERNPFGVTVTIRQTYGKALADISTALKQVGDV